MIAPEIRHFLNLSEESHAVAKTLFDLEHYRFSVAQSYYTIFYLAEAMLLSKGLTFSSHSAVIL
ncbi:MAG: HEPN domain-containing protein [Anaerolineales bacterium]